AKLELNSYNDKKEVPNQTNLNLTYSTADKETNKNVKVEYQKPIVKDESNIQPIFSHLDTTKHEVEQTIYVNPLKLKAKNTNVTVKRGGVADNGDYYTGDGSTINDSNTELKVYTVASDQQLPQRN
ncbi:fibrinogen-binding adhesin SdrG C-terminal domain-containing protein, partial [Staphylococcus aureus]|uniref:fibrinogen-binding adhesin SdrG C-terminal domain-containing protein n=1 Tax=Staphylococcus aureus TaxID=1280 RepID=UPI00210B4B3C